jgi:hypothetical protein
VEWSDVRLRWSEVRVRRSGSGVVGEERASLTLGLAPLM